MSGPDLFVQETPFALSLSKRVPTFFLGKRKVTGFDRLSPNGWGLWVCV